MSKGWTVSFWDISMSILWAKLAFLRQAFAIITFLGEYSKHQQCTYFRIQQLVSIRPVIVVEDYMRFLVRQHTEKDNS